MENPSDDTAPAGTARLLRAWPACAHALVATESEAELLEAFCRGLVEQGGYASATIRLETDHREHPAEMTTGSRADGVPTHFPLAHAGLPLGVLTVHAAAGPGADPAESSGLAALADELAAALARIRREARERSRFAALGRSEETYRGVFENTGTGTIIIDPDMLIVFANARFADLCGYPKEEIEGRLRWSQFVHPDDLQMMQRYHHGRRRGEPGIPTEYESRVVDRSGSTRHVYMKVGMIPGTSQSIASFMDVTERKIAEERLRASEALYRGVFENTGTGTLTIDAQMLILCSNARFAELCGYGREEIDGKMKWSQFVHPGDLEMMQRYHYGRRKGDAGIPSEYECRIVHRSGATRHIYMKVGMIPGSSQSVASFLDITERRTAEEALRQSEAKLSSIVEAFEGLIYIATPDHRLEFANRKLLERAGRAGAGEPCFRVVHHLDAPCPWCTNGRVLGGERVRSECHSPRDGRWFAEMRSPVYGEGDIPVKVETILVDITDRKLAEQQLAESAEYLRTENLRLRSTIGDRYRFGPIVGKSRVMQEVYEVILKAAASVDPVVISGASGTGKELVARAIHDLSPRAKGRFVPVNCGAISEHIIESEFFGYKRGAFTGAHTDRAGYLDAADGGTLFLDEVGEIGLGLQVKLLRAIEGGGYSPVGGHEVRRPDLRVVAATNRDLKVLVEQGTMRSDFYYRIHVVPIRLPALRERKEDIPLLIDHFLLSHPGARPPMTAQILAALHAYDWPGNVRELENVLKRYLTLNRIDLAELGRPARPQAPSRGEGLEERLDALEREILEEALKEQRWHRERTAAALGIHRKTLFTKLKKHGLL